MPCHIVVRHLDSINIPDKQQDGKMANLLSRSGIGSRLTAYFTGLVTNLSRRLIRCRFVHVVPANRLRIVVIR